MKYDISELNVKAGKKIKLTFVNPDFMPHRLVLTKPKSGCCCAGRYPSVPGV